jgi:ribonuclease III
MKNDYTALYRKIGYTFTNVALLHQALSHRSYGAQNNERLEFLGDSIVNMVIAHALFHKFPNAPEGDLSRVRASLVKGEMLAQIAHDLNLGEHLNLGQGELKSGGFRRASILADALEAIFAAISLDSDLATCHKIILNIYSSRLENLSIAQQIKDPKTELQEYMQRKKRELPRYYLQKILGDEHNQIFYVTCEVHTIQTTGHGETRRKAEQMAADEALQMLNKSVDN